MKNYFSLSFQIESDYNVLKFTLCENGYRIIPLNDLPVSLNIDDLDKLINGLIALKQNNNIENIKNKL